MIAHVPRITLEWVNRLKAIGGGLSLTGWQYLAGNLPATAPQYAGPPFRLIVDSGIPAGMSSDGMQIAPMNPWIHMYYATTGLNARGVQINPGQQISRQEVLALYTSRNGWFLRKEDDLGSLEPGKLADLAVLNKDYFSVPGPGAEADPLRADGGRREDRPRRRLDQRLARSRAGALRRRAPARGAARGAAAPPRGQPGRRRRPPDLRRCGRGVGHGPDRWRHVRREPGRRAARMALSPTLADLRACATYERFAATYPWAVRPDGGGVRASTESQWREAVARLGRYEERLRAVGAPRALGPDENPYLELVELLGRRAARAGGPARRARRGAAAALLGTAVRAAQLLDLSERRRELVARFAWAIPGDARSTCSPATRRSSTAAPGPGTGRAAPRARRRRDRVRPRAAPPRSASGGRRCARARPSDAARAPTPTARSLLCWPPYDDDDASYAPLRAYRGDVVAFVGERDGAPGSVRFHRELALNWTAVEEVELARWPASTTGWSSTGGTRSPGRTPCATAAPSAGASAARLDRPLRRVPRGPAAGARAAVGRHRIEYAAETLAALPPALRRALEAARRGSADGTRLQQRLTRPGALTPHPPQ